MTMLRRSLQVSTFSRVAPNIGLLTHGPKPVDKYDALRPNSKFQLDVRARVHLSLPYPAL